MKSLCNGISVWSVIHTNDAGSTTPIATYSTSIEATVQAARFAESWTSAGSFSVMEQPILDLIRHRYADAGCGSWVCEDCGEPHWHGAADSICELGSPCPAGLDHI